MSRHALAFGAILLLSGCAASSGVDFTSLTQRIGPPNSTQSRIVILQEKVHGLGLAFCQCEMKLDGDAIGKARPGTYIYADRPAGRHWLVASETLYQGDTTREIRTEPGRTFFFLVRSSKRHDAITGSGLVGGLAGMAVVSVATAGTENPGPADIFPLDEATARTTLAELRLSE
jgi:Protein of unknown function (DUF2846)